MKQRVALQSREFAVAQGLTLLLALSFLILPALAMIASERGAGATPSVLAAAAGLAALVIAAAGLEYSRAISMGRACGKVELGVMAEFTLRLLRLKPVLVTHLPVDDLARALSGLHRVIGNLQGGPVRQWLDAALMVVVLVFVWRIHSALAVTAAALAALGVALPLLLSRSGRAQESGHERARLTSRRFLFDVVSGFSRLRLLNSGQAAIERWLERHQRDVQSGQRVEGIDTRLSSLQETYPWMALAALALGVTSFIDGLSTGACLAIVVVWGSLMEGALGLGTAGVALLRSMPWAGDADILATPSLEPLATGEAASKQPIEILDVAYRYRGSAALSLDGVSLRVDPGEFIAITGPSGGGKSTLLRLIVGVDQPESGEIQVGSAGEGESGRLAWRRTVGMVRQDERVESAIMIRSQIAGFGTFGVDEVWQAARLTLLADDIARMPMGLQTIVETGKMSTGQEQRLLIAREVVRRPSVLILDEATNAIPDAVQAELFANLRRLGLTCILVTHRETAIALMDRVVVIERGRVAWSGTPAQIATRADLVEMLRAERQAGHN